MRALLATLRRARIPVATDRVVEVANAAQTTTTAPSALSGAARALATTPAKRSNTPSESRAASAASARMAARLPSSARVSPGSLASAISGRASVAAVPTRALSSVGSFVARLSSGYTPPKKTELFPVPPVLSLSDFGGFKKDVKRSEPGACAHDIYTATLNPKILGRSSLCYIKNRATNKVFPIGKVTFEPHEIDYAYSLFLPGKSKEQATDKEKLMVRAKMEIAFARYLAECEVEAGETARAIKPDGRIPKTFVVCDDKENPTAWYVASVALEGIFYSFQDLAGIKPVEELFFRGRKEKGEEEGLTYLRGHLPLEDGGFRPFKVRVTGRIFAREIIRFLELGDSKALTSNSGLLHRKSTDMVARVALIDFDSSGSEKTEDGEIIIKSAEEIAFEAPPSADHALNLPREEFSGLANRTVRKGEAFGAIAGIGSGEYLTHMRSYHCPESHLLFPERIAMRVERRKNAVETYQEVDRIFYERNHGNDFVTTKER